MFTYVAFPNQASPKTPPQRTNPTYQKTPRLEMPQFDSLPFSFVFPGLLDDDIVTCQDVQYFSSIKDVTPEWNDYKSDDNDPCSEPGEGSPSVSPTSNIERSQVPVLEQFQTCIAHSLPAVSDTTFSDIPPFSDFLFDSASSMSGEAVCIKRSDGQLYAIRKLLQTRQVWSQLDILVKIKEARLPFCPLLHWTYEMDHHIYVITENYPSKTLADAIVQYGPFGSLDIFFYACEIVMGLHFLHDLEIIHRNVSPRTIIFDRQGHVILSGIENSITLRQRNNFPYDYAHEGQDRYHAPELLLGWSHDEKVDSWAFGMVLYFMYHGKNPFSTDMTTAENQVPGKDVKHIVSRHLLNKSMRFINPIARGLILKCVERNPAIRLTMGDIQRHPYFSSADWEQVSKQNEPAPLPHDFLTSKVIRPPVAVYESQSCPREQCFSPGMKSPSPENTQQTFGQAAPQFLRSPFMTCETRGDVPDVPIKHTILPMALNQENRCEASQQTIHFPSAVFVHQAGGAEGTQALSKIKASHMADFWDSLDREDKHSTYSESSGLSNIRIPFSLAWTLRKERSLTIYPHRLFNPSTNPRKLRRPKSVAALKHAAYAEPIADLPKGLSQIGSGIGFMYKAPSVQMSVPGTVPLSASPALRPKPSSCFGPSRHRSVSSECTVAVPKACHGLLQSLSLSSFWTGFKNESAMSTASPISPSWCSGGDDTNCDPRRDHSINFANLVPDSIHGHVQSQSVEYTRAEIMQPLAESTAFFSPGQEALSPITTSTSSAEEEVLTPDTVDFQIGNSIRISEDEIVEMKRSDRDAYCFSPEATLRLVTPMNGMRLAHSPGPYSP